MSTICNKGSYRDEKIVVTWGYMHRNSGYIHRVTNIERVVTRGYIDINSGYKGSHAYKEWLHGVT